MKYLLFLTWICFPALAQKTAIPIIDSKAVKINNLLWDLKSLSEVPQIEWLDHNEKVRTLLYKSVDYEGKPTQVFAYYSNPDIIAGKTSNTKFPGVVLIHGGGGKAFKEWVEKWAVAGYAAIAMDLAGKDGDGKQLANPGPDQSNENKFGKIETAPLKDVWTYHAVASSILAHSLLLSFPEIDENRTCVTGISWGGYLTCIVSSLDNRFKAAVPVYGCSYYDESDVFGEPLKKLSPENKQKWMAYFDPSVYLPFAKPKFLFLNGNKDKHYNVVPYDKTYRLIAESQRTICIKPDMKHSHEWGWEPIEIQYFFDSIVRNGKPMPVVSKVSQKDTLLSISYQSSVPIANAEFYYSNDTLSTNENRKWSVKGATIDGKSNTIVSGKPTEGFKYGFFYLKDQQNIGVSSEFLILK